MVSWEASCSSGAAVPGDRHCTHFRPVPSPGGRSSQPGLPVLCYRQCLQWSIFYPSASSTAVGQCWHRGVCHQDLVSKCTALSVSSREGWAPSIWHCFRTQVRQWGNYRSVKRHKPNISVPMRRVLLFLWKTVQSPLFWPWLGLRIKLQPAVLLQIWLNLHEKVKYFFEISTQEPYGSYGFLRPFFIHNTSIAWTQILPILQPWQRQSVAKQQPLIFPSGHTEAVVSLLNEVRFHQLVYRFADSDGCHRLATISLSATHHLGPLAWPVQWLLKAMLIREPSWLKWIGKRKESKVLLTGYFVHGFWSLSVPGMACCRVTEIVI